MGDRLERKSALLGGQYHVLDVIALGLEFYRFRPIFGSSMDTPVSFALSSRIIFLATAPLLCMPCFIPRSPYLVPICVDCVDRRCCVVCGRSRCEPCCKLTVAPSLHGCNSSFASPCVQNFGQ